MDTVKGEQILKPTWVGSSGIGTFFGTEQILIVDELRVNSSMSFRSILLLMTERSYASLIDSVSLRPLVNAEQYMLCHRLIFPGLL